MQLIVHGGAGSAPDDPAARHAILQDAAEAGVDATTPLDAVEAAVAVLEESPKFNAGRGGAVQADRGVRTDAGVMTEERAVGAVCGMPGVVRAVGVARVVLERTPHVLVAGNHAVHLAEVAGIETGCNLLTDATRQRYADADPPDGDGEALLEWVRNHYGGGDEPAADDHDTVGAVAVGDDGRLAAATSTGGRWFAFPGRVGDTPQVGAGFYANHAGGASATGWGEDIARVTLCRDAVGRLETGEDPLTAAEQSIAMLGEQTGGDAGIIVADRDGRVGSAFNTELMQTATAPG